MTTRLLTLKANWRERPAIMPYCKTFTWGDLSVFVGEEPDTGWHLSISHPRRYPTWDEIKTARYDLVPPDVTMVMILPPVSDFVNIHQNCFHLWQTDDDLHALKR